MTLNVSMQVLTSSVPVGPAVVNVSKSNLIAQTSTWNERKNVCDLVKPGFCFLRMWEKNLKEPKKSRERQTIRIGKWFSFKQSSGGS